MYQVWTHPIKSQWPDHLLMIRNKVCLFLVCLAFKHHKACISSLLFLCKCFGLSVTRIIHENHLNFLSADWLFNKLIIYKVKRLPSRQVLSFWMILLLKHTNFKVKKENILLYSIVVFSQSTGFDFTGPSSGQKLWNQNVYSWWSLGITAQTWMQKWNNSHNDIEVINITKRTIDKWQNCTVLLLKITAQLSHCNSKRSSSENTGFVSPTDWLIIISGLWLQPRKN